MSQVHHHHHDNLTGTKLLVAVFLNVLITTGQIVGGLFSGSLALLSDALHNFSDVTALIISYIANRLAKRVPTPTRTFGYKRAEILAALINSATLIIIAVFLIKEAVDRFLHPVAVNGGLVMALGGASIIFNGASVLLLKKEAAESSNIRSAYIHLFTDMLSSVAVVLGGAAVRFWGVVWADGALAAVIALYLFFSSGRLVLETLKVLMQFAPDHLDVAEISGGVAGIGPVLGLHHMHLWRLNDHEIHLEAHVDFREDLTLGEVQKVLDQVRAVLKTKFAITHTTLQPEFERGLDQKLVVHRC